MDKCTKALELFDNGYSCAQSILIAFASEVGIDEDLAFRIGAGLGGGVGRTQNICGAVNAGAIILGLRHGNYPPTDTESKNRLADKVGKFVLECKNSLGATQCLDLIKVDLNNPEQKQFANESGLLSRICNNAVSKTAEILSGYL
ncbi:MAG: C-GCAxxG-C-C family protein [Tenuifilaceae bacterium]|jgi:C_GCAxxG_C_C family probable redox protein|nr:C-GCAxxG-C-C family protein [Tenuifilaceae bacterium]